MPKSRKGGRSVAENTSMGGPMETQDPEEYQPPREESYWGSVRFFKHLILTVLALAILIPTTLSIIFGVSLGRTKAELKQLRQTVSTQPAPGPSGGQQGDGTAQPAGDGSQAAGDSSQSQGEGQPSKNGGPEFPAYQELYPDLYAKPANLNSIDQEKTVYLTFDDGPSARTPELLAILEEYDIKATFFVVGRESEEAKQWMRDIVAAGHTLGIHTYSHDYNKIYQSVEAYLEDFNAMYNLILEATGVAPQVFRFPGGSVNAYNGATYRDIISEMVRRGFVYFDWNRMSGDAVRGNVPAETLVENALDRADTMRRVILLMHDSTRFTNVVEALPQIIEGYQEAGFSFAALTQEVKPVIYSYPD